MLLVCFVGGPLPLVSELALINQLESEKGLHPMLISIFRTRRTLFGIIAVRQPLHNTSNSTVKWLIRRKFIVRMNLFTKCHFLLVPSKLRVAQILIKLNLCNATFESNSLMNALVPAIRFIDLLFCPSNCCIAMIL